MFRRNMIRWLGVFAVGALLGMAQTASAQDSKKEKPIDDKVIQSADGWPLKLTYYKSTEGKEAAVVVLLHGKGDNRLVWTAPKGFAETLHSKGFAVIALDLRKHGESKPGGDDSDAASKKEKEKSAKKSSNSDLKPVDYPAMVADLEAVKRFIYEEHEQKNLNMRKLAIVAPEMSAAIAITYAVADWAKNPFDDASTPIARTPRGQDVQALVLLSPETNLPGVLSTQVAGALKSTPLAALVVVSKGDSQDKDQAKKIFVQLGGDAAKTAPATKKAEPKKGKEKEKDTEKEKEKNDKQRHFLVELPGKLRGTELIGKKLVTEDVMLNFLKEQVQDRKGTFYEWRDRKSRLVSD